MPTPYTHIYKLGPVREETGEGPHMHVPIHGPHPAGWQENEDERKGKIPSVQRTK